MCWIRQSRHSHVFMVTCTFRFKSSEVLPRAIFRTICGPRRRYFSPLSTCLDLYLASASAPSTVRRSPLKHILQLPLSRFPLITLFFLPKVCASMCTWYTTSTHAIGLRKHQDQLPSRRELPGLKHALGQRKRRENENEQSFVPPPEMWQTICDGTQKHMVDKVLQLFIIAV